MFWIVFFGALIICQKQASKIIFHAYDSDLPPSMAFKEFIANDQIFKDFHVSSDVIGKQASIATKPTKYIELFIVNDFARYEQFHRDLAAIEDQTFELIKLVQTYYSKESFEEYNLQVHLAGMFTETEQEIFLPDQPKMVDSSLLLEKFCAWKNEEMKSEKLKPGSSIFTGLSIDTAHLLSGRLFRGKSKSGSKNTTETVEGLSYVKGMCSKMTSCGIERAPFDANPFNIASVLAHEIGHNLGYGHDGIGNECLPYGNIMQATSCSVCHVVANSWSSCSKEVIGGFLASTDSVCLNNKPNLCGNGFIDDGEECDSGLLNGSNCCTADCKLRPGAQCDDHAGSCCKNCTFVPSGNLCRVRRLDESSIKAACEESHSYCNGIASECPIQRLNDGTFCSAVKDNTNFSGICVAGYCRSRELLCKQLGLDYSSHCDPDLNCNVICYDTSSPSVEFPTHDSLGTVMPMSNSTTFQSLVKSTQGRCVSVSVQQFSGEAGVLSFPDHIQCQIAQKGIFGSFSKTAGICQAGKCISQSSTADKIKLFKMTLLLLL